MVVPLQITWQGENTLYCDKKFIQSMSVQVNESNANQQSIQQAQNSTAQIINGKLTIQQEYDTCKLSVSWLVIEKLINYTYPLLSVNIHYILQYLFNSAKKKSKTVFQLPVFIPHNKQFLMLPCKVDAKLKRLVKYQQQQQHQKKQNSIKQAINYSIFISIPNTIIDLITFDAVSYENQQQSDEEKHVKFTEVYTAAHLFSNAYKPGFSSVAIARRRSDDPLSIVCAYST